MKIVITGGTGFIGDVLVMRLIGAGHSIVLLSRHSAEIRQDTQSPIHIEQWDGKTVGPWAAHLSGADAVINLAGEPIAAKRWTVAQKERIVQSRINATRAIVDAIARSSTKPTVLVNASAVGYYGDVPDGDVAESHPKGNDFLSDTCDQWERETQAAEKLGVRVVRLRFGVVLEKKGGALKRLLLPYNFFVGGPIGSGRQWFPWVHLEDVVGIVLFALQNHRLSGPVNVAAPQPVTMKEFCAALGKAIRRPSWAPVPAFALRFALGEMSGMLLGGQRVIPQKLLDEGYHFRYLKLDEALQSIFKKK